MWVRTIPRGKAASERLPKILGNGGAVLIIASFMELAFSLTLQKILEYPAIRGIYVTSGGIIGIGEALKKTTRG